MRQASAFLLVAATAITSCSLASPELDLFFNKQGQLTIQTERVWRWFIIPDRADACLNALRVYDDTKFVWQIRTEKCEEKAFPITYGVTPAGFEVVTPPQALVLGKRYGIAVCGDYPLATHMDFVPVTHGRPRAAREWEVDNLIRSPHDREDRLRVEAYERGEKINEVDRCTRLPAKY